MAAAAHQPNGTSSPSTRVAPSAHTGAVRGLAVIPAWAAPPHGQIRDAHHIAVAFAERGATDAHPVADSFSWVTTGGKSPLSERLDLPTAEVVRGEMMLGDNVLAARPMPDSLWAMLGVAPAKPVTTDREWAQGVVNTLAWLLGAQRQPPIALPRRLEDGSTPTAEQLYDEAKARALNFGPEERLAARLKAERDAARYRVLADLAAPKR